LADVAEVCLDVFRVNSEGPRFVRAKEPRLEEVPDQEFVARHVPQQEGFPLIEREPVFDENNEWPVTAAWAEPTAVAPTAVPTPRRTLGADEVLGTKAIKVLALGAIEIPRREDGVSLLHHRTFDNREGRGDVLASRLHAPALRM